MRVEATSHLDSSIAEQYHTLTLNSRDSMFYHSLKYMRFLASFIGATPFTLICFEGDNILGALPAFIKHHSDGAVLNSLPFYGSHGGVILRKGVQGDQARRTRDRLLDQLMQECSELDVALCTIITSPFDVGLADYKRGLSPRYVQDRIAQMVALPPREQESDLAARFESRCRRSIRKAVRSKISVRVMREDEPSLVDRIYEMHTENMQKTGAPVKPKVFFERIHEFFDLHQDYEIYVAECQGQTIAALLVFYFNGVAEYFVPAVDVEHRELNPMHLILVSAMTDASRRGMSIWNFGGTHQVMDGVYLFKRSFGAKDYHYHYLTAAFSDLSRSIRLTPSEMRSTYTWFYVLPYSALSQSDSGLHQ
jgi:predicted N-acyltransferase